MNVHPATLDSLRDLIRQIHAERPLDVVVGADTRFVTDLGFTSLELIGLVFLCEQSFGVSLIDQGGLLSQLRTVGQAVTAIDNLQHGREFDADPSVATAAITA
jgi:acyl carrier protein